MKTYNIAVIFGGCSPEYGISLESACGVLSHLDRERFVPVMIGISREGSWFYFSGDIRKIAEDTWCNAADCVPVVWSLQREKKGFFLTEEGTVRFLPVDAALPVLHGKNGEDGTVQGMLALAGIPLAGCGILASALCMDKHRAHRLAAAAGIRVPKGVVLKRQQLAAELAAMREQLPAEPAEEQEQLLKQESGLEAFAEEIGFPLFVKPVKAGSSYGVTRVCRREELWDAVRLAFQYDDEVLVEENLEGFEVGCAVLGTQRLVTGEVDEIELSGGFFDFTEKYTLKTSAIHVPARISGQKAQEIKETAKAVYRALGCSVFARVDLFLTPEGEVIFHEVNTIPGFTEHSRYPGMMKAAGYSLKELLTQILELALEPQRPET